MKGHDVRIEQENERVAKVFIDGNELKDVQYVNYNIRVADAPIITVEFIPSTLNFDKQKKTMTDEQMLEQVMVLNKKLGGVVEEKEDKKDLKATIIIDSKEIVDKVVKKLNEQAKLQNNKGVVI